MVKRCLPLVLLACWLSAAGNVRAQDADEYLDPRGGRFTASFDYLWAWMRPDFFPAMATVGNVNDNVPGALGQPGTTILFGNQNLDHFQIYGGRVNMSYWLNDQRSLCLEGNFFLLEQQTINFNTSADGSSPTAVLAKPFFNPVANQEDADPRAFPGALAGNINFNYSTRCMGAELNARWFLFGDTNVDGLTLNVLGGVRWLTLQEKYTSAETSTELPAGTGSTFFISDSFATYNQYFGAQLGLQLKCRWDSNLTFDIQGKCALGPNMETLQINGFTSVLDQFGNVTTGNQGLYAQPSNVGQQNHTVIAMMPEGSANFGWEPTSWFKLQLGYTFMYLTKVIRPGQEIDRTVNIQPVGATEQFGPSRPAASFNQTGFWLQFINVGVGFTY